jgi:aspartyl-tRNA(Asn)/glutamyl-tRNA(Gln) amidotransferase subunit A
MSFDPTITPTSLTALRSYYLRGETTPQAVLNAALARSNSNASRNTYLAQNPAWSSLEAQCLGPSQIHKQPLWGVPISLKDCFDLASFATSCGSSFYREHHGVATKDSAVATRLRAAGAVITGKTHLHQLAYGITGQNHDFGDCVQPANANLLTGGSSSGAAASVQEGSALAAIGTDTGGSIRVPAALCGFAGYRSSITLQSGLWQGGAHLAPSFDTLGWLYRNLADGPMLARVLFDLPTASAPSLNALRIGIPDEAFLHDCEDDVRSTLHQWQSSLEQQGARITAFDSSFWNGTLNLFAPIQASEAAAIHQGNFHHFEPVIAERLAWGESIPASTLADLRQQLQQFRAQMAELFKNFDYLLMPCAPMSSLSATADHSHTRTRILRYTTPISLAGLPVVTLPCTAGGLQLIGPLGSDAKLLALSAALA